MNDKKTLLYSFKVKQIIEKPGHPRVEGIAFCLAKFDKKSFCNKLTYPTWKKKRKKEFRDFNIKFS